MNDSAYKIENLKSIPSFDLYTLRRDESLKPEFKAAVHKESTVREIVGASVQPPSWLTSSIHKVIKHTPDVLVFRENKASNSPSCAYFFTGDMAGRSMEITPSLATQLNEITTFLMERR